MRWGVLRNVFLRPNGPTRCYRSDRQRSARMVIAFVKGMRRPHREATRSALRAFARRIAAGLVVLGAACGASTTEPAQSKFATVTADVAQAAAAMTGQNAPMADAYTKGRYVGFDTHTYPGTPVMRTWKETPGAPSVGRLLSAVALSRERVVDGQAGHPSADGVGTCGDLRRTADVGQDAPSSLGDSARRATQTHRLLD